MAYNVNEGISMNMYGAILPQNVMTQLPGNLALSAQVEHIQNFSHGQVTTAQLHIPQVSQMTTTVGGQSYIVVPTTTEIPIATVTTGGSSSGDGKSGNEKEEQKMKPEILKKMKKLRDERKYCDLWIDVKGVRFQAHRCILAAWSPYFDSQLISEEPMVKDLMIVNYDSYEVFADLLEFLYTGVIAPRETNFLQLLHLAVSFQIDLLKSYCEEFLRCNLHLGNFISTYFLSRKYKLDSLEKHIVSFLQMNLSDTVKQSEFMSLPASRFNAFLSSGFMNQIKPEIKLFLIISWVGYDVNERERYLVLLLGHIDWSTVATDFLLEISRTENFFTSHESSLYLLLQTLYSSGISLGPYAELFPGLRQTYNHLLNDIVNSGIILPEPDDFVPVTVTAICTKNRTMTSAVCTDLRGLMNEDLTITPLAESKHRQPFEGAQVVEGTVTHYEYVDPSKEFLHSNKKLEGTDTQHREVRLDEKSGSFLVEISKSEVSQPVVKKYGKQRGRPPVIKSSDSPKQFNSLDESTLASELPTKLPIKRSKEEDAIKKEDGSVKAKGKKRGGKGKQKKKIVEPAEFEVEEEEEEIFDEEMKEEIKDDEDEMIEEDFMNGEDHEETFEDDDNSSDKDWNPEKEEDGGAKYTSNLRSGKRLRQLARDLKGTKKLGSARGRGAKHHCPYCEYTAQSNNRLNNHIKRNHENNMTYKCTLCEFETKWNRKYYEHLRLVHFPGPPFCCETCDYNSDKLQALIIHRAKHSDDRPHACDQCDMRFRTRNNLLAHIKTHLGLRPFACKVCKKTFATKNTLEQHVVIHSSDRPYLCDQCGFSSKYQSHLISHKRIHTGNTYPCSYPKCTYSTPKRSQLKAHMRSHLGIRQFTCEQCGKSFIEKSHLVRHERIHMTDKPFKCELCSYTSTRSDKLKEHMSKHHSDTPQAKPQKTRKSAKERKNKETPKNFPHYDHASYTIPQVAQAETADAAAAYLQDFRMNLGTLMVPVSSDQVVTEGQVITAGVEHANIIHIPTTSEGVEVVHSPGGTETPGATIIPEDHQAYISLGVQQGEGTATHHQLQTVAVPLSQPGQQGQQQDYGGLSAFMALF